MDDRRILYAYPLPLARGYRRYLNAAGARDRHDAAYFLFEIYLKYTASIAIATYLALEERDHRVNAALKGLARPSLGEWLRFLRESLAFVAGRPDPDPAIQAAARLFGARESRWGEVLALQNAMLSFREKAPSQKERVSLESLLGEVVAYRNAVVGHGAPLEAEHYERFANLFARAFREVLEESPFLLARRLVAFDSIQVRDGSKVELSAVEFMGDNPLRGQAPLVISYGAKIPREKTLHLLGDDGKFLSLDPLLVAHKEDVYVLNEAQGSPEYLSYSTGDRYKPSRLGEVEGDLFQRILGYQVDASRLSRIGDDVAPESKSAPPSGDGEQKLGDYRILRELGRGAMGIVFEAVQESLGRRVALKVLPGTFALDPRRVERFRREARATARIHHPSIIPVYEVGEAQATHYYAMEFIDGPPLDKLLSRAREDAAARQQNGSSRGRRAGPTILPRGSGSSSMADPAYISHAVEQIALVAEGLHEAHKLGLIHRDLKPSNILTDSGGRYVLVDFGLVHEAEARTLTRSGELVGTLNYMSPEQVSRGQVDARSDVYSLGATLYEVLTLRPPFERGNEHETQRAILFEEPAPPRKLNPHLNRDIETVILHALEKNPEKRYASAGDLAADLKRFLRYEPIRARPLTALTRIGRRIWRRRAAVAAAAAIAVLLVALGSVLLWSGHKDRLRRIAEYEPRVLREVLKLQLGSLLRPSASARAELDPAGLASRRDLDALAASSGLDPVEEATRGLADAAAEVPERPEAYYHRARGLDLLGRDEEALAEAGRALERDAGFVPALVLRAALLEKQGKQAEALAERERAKKLGQGGWAEIWLSAHEARGAERWEETAEAFQKLIDLEGSGEAAYLGSSIESRLGRASALLESRRFDDAIIELKVAKGLWRKAAEPDLLLGKAYYLMGNEVGAEAALLDLWKRAQSPDEAALAIASMYQGFQRSDKGLEWIERVSREGLKARNRALFLGSIGRWKEAAESARRATEIDPRDARAWANLGLALFTLRRIVPAEDAVRKAIEIDPEEAGPHDILGMILERWGKLEEARLEIAKALEKDPGHAQALTHLGFVLERQGQPEEAERCYRKAVRLEPGPGKSGLHYGLSFFLHRHGRLEELIDSLKEAVRRDPRDAIAQSHLAISLVDGAHDIVELGEATRKAVALDSRNPFTLNILYLVLSAEGKPKEALEVQKKNTELGSNNPVMWSNLGNACRGAGKLDEAATAYRRSLSIDPAGVSAFVAHVNLCDVLLNQGKLWEEIRALQEALLRDPEDPILASQLGIALETEGSHEEASEAFLQATRLDPTFALAHMHLGNCYAALRKPAEAEASYKKAVELQFGGGPGLLLQTALGDFYGSQGKLDLAIESYRKALASSPNPFIAPTGSLANFLHTRGKLGEALALYAREIRWFPVDGEVGFEANLWSILRNEKDIPGVGRELDGILNILEAAERWKPEDMGRPLKSLALFWLHHPERRDLAKALDYARRALKEGKPDDPEAYLVLAEAYALSGRLADAVLTLEKAMRLEHATGNITGWLEKYRSAVLPDLLSPASIDRAVAALDLETLVAAGAEWRFFRGKREPCEQLGWTAPGFDDGAESGWEKGPSGFGFGDNDDRTTLDDMLESYTTVYIRRRFQVPDPAAFRRLVLSVRVDDGFVAYLNGEEVGRSRAPGEPGAKVPFDAAATGYVPDWEDIEVSIDPKNLRAGENLLAIQGLNNSKSSSDLSLVPVLEAERPPDPARDAKLVADFRAAARGDDAPARLAYLEGRLRQRAGKPDEAAGKLAEAASALKGSPEPVIRLAESLRAAGRPAEARDRLAGALRSVHRGEKRVWNLWLQVLLVDLRLAPADILAALPAASAEATDRLEPYADDIHWLLERLKENQPVRIDCGATRESSGGWGSDRFYESGNREEESYPRIETLYVGEIAGTEEDALYRTDRLFLPEELRPPAYRVPLPPGSYSVTLHFAERWFVKPGTRVFDVLLEGKKVLERHDPFARVGPATADRETLRGVRVDDGILDIELRARTDNPSIAAIEIAPER